MRRNPDRTGTQVELLNVPHYSQGDFDGLCVYYSGAMMLSTLIPEISALFGTAGERATKFMSRDPLIATQNTSDQRKKLASWFYHGETVSSLKTTMNKIVPSYEISRRTKFKHEKLQRRESTFNKITESINNGLPVVLGFDTRDYGSHAVLVRGYWTGKEKWLITNDPGGGHDYSWDSLKTQNRGGFHIVLCTQHYGPRPMMQKLVNDIAEIHQWMPKGNYEPLNKIWNIRET